MFQVVLFVSLSAVASLFTQICREFESETISEIQKKCSNANTTLCERSRVSIVNMTSLNKSSERFDHYNIYFHVFLKIIFNYFHWG